MSGMASVLHAWVASHTGLPSLHVSGPGTLTAEGGRTVVVLPPGEHLLSDPLAVPGSATRYLLGSDAVTLTRRDDGHQFSDATGRGVVPLAWLGDDEDEWDAGVSVMGTSVRRSPIVRWSIAAPTSSGRMEARTTGAAGSEGMRSLAIGRGLVAAVHSPSSCEVPDCDIPPVRLVLVEKMTSRRTGHVSRGRRDWLIDWRGVDPSELNVPRAPVVTWGEWAAYGAAHPEVSGWRAWSALEVARRVSGMPV